MRFKVAKQLSNDYADPNLHTDSLRKDLLLFLQSARAGPGDGGRGWDEGGLWGSAESSSVCRK